MQTSVSQRLLGNLGPMILIVKPSNGEGILARFVAACSPPSSLRLKVRTNAFGLNGAAVDVFDHALALSHRNIARTWMNPAMVGRGAQRAVADPRHFVQTSATLWRRDRPIC